MVKPLEAPIRRVMRRGGGQATAPLSTMPARRVEKSVGRNADRIYCPRCGSKRTACHCDPSTSA